MDSSQFFIVGANGQLGTALKKQYPEARFADVGELDITDKVSVNKYGWSNIKVILNAAAYTNVDGAETSEGRVAAWSVNANAASNLVKVALLHKITLVHISTDYVFDGTKSEHEETESFSPLSVYGASKAAGDIAVSLLEAHYILRTSWVIGEGKNFVRTMLGVGQKGINPKVVSDQIGRLTFTSELVRAIDHLLSNELPYGTYNISNSGRSASWADITRRIYEYAKIGAQVSDTTTPEYFKEKPQAAPRPLNSTLSLDKIRQTSFRSNDWEEDLKKYIETQDAIK